MTRIPECTDLSELGSQAAMTAFGWTSGVPGTSPVYSDALGNHGTYSSSVNVGAGLSVTTPTFATPVPTLFFRAHLRGAPLGASTHLIQFRHGTTVLVSLVVAADGSGRLTFWRGTADTGMLLATSTSAIVLSNTWYLLECRVTIGSGTAGVVELKVNGTTTGWIPLLACNTQPGSDTTVDNLLFGGRPGGLGSGIFYLDDQAADDSGYIGDGLVLLLAPTGAGTTTQLTPTGVASNWDNVNEVPFSDTDYNEADSVNLKDTYTHASLPASIATVRSVTIAARVVKAGSTINNGYLVTRSGGTDYESSAKPLPIAYAGIMTARTVDPATGIAWTPAGVNATEFGIRFDA